MGRGGRRVGAGRPAKPVEQHLAEGTFRACRHSHLLARPLPGRKPPSLALQARRLQLLGRSHWRYNSDQLELAREGPEWLLFEGEAETAAEQAAVALWQAWDTQDGLRWRLQNECPTIEDETRLSAQRGVDVAAEQLVEAVEAAVAAWEATLPNPPGWDELRKPKDPAAQAPAASERDDLFVQVGCGNCGAQLLLLSGSLGALLNARTLERLRIRLITMDDDQGHGFALADKHGHFPCPHCTQDQFNHNARAK